MAIKKQLVIMQLVGLPGNQFNEYWYISKGMKEIYLRKDGTIGATTKDNNGEYGFWQTMQQAQDFLDNCKEDETWL